MLTQTNKKSYYNNDNAYSKNEYSNITHYLTELNKKGEIDYKEFSTLITYTTAKLVEKEIERKIGKYFIKDFSNYMRKVFLNARK